MAIDTNSPNIPPEAPHMSPEQITAQIQREQATYKARRRLWKSALADALRRPASATRGFTMFAVDAYFPGDIKRYRVTARLDANGRMFAFVGESVHRLHGWEHFVEWLAERPRAHGPVMGLSMRRAPAVLLPSRPRAVLAEEPVLAEEREGE